MKMKNCFYMAACAALAFAAGCATDSNELATGYGNVDITLRIDTTLTNVAGAAAVAVDAPAEADFTIYATNRSTGSTKSWASIEEFQSGLKKLAVGSYEFCAVSGDTLQEGFRAPAFRGKAEARVVEGGTTSVDLSCSVAGTLVTLNCSDNVSSLLADFVLRVKSEAGGYVEFPAAETRAATVVPGNVRGELVLTDAAGRRVALQPFEPVASKAGEHYELRVDASEENGVPTISIVFNEATPSAPYQLAVGEEFFTTAAPTISPFGFDDGGKLSLLEYNRPSQPAGCAIAVPGGLRNLYLTVTGGDPSDTPWPQETDLVGADPAELAAAGLTVSGNEAGSQSVSVDFSGALASLEVADGETEAVHNFILQARDAAGRLAESPATLTVVTTPLELSLATPDNIPLSDEEVEIEMEYNGSDPASNVTFEYKSSYDSEWTAASPTSVTALAEEGKYKASVPLRTGTLDLSIRALYGGGLAYSNTVTVGRIVPEFSVSCAAENVWSSRADLMVDCADNQSLIPYLPVYVSEQGGSWHPAVTDRDPEEGRITVKTLMPDTQYSIMVATGGTAVYTISVTTEPALGLPNADFDEGETTISIPSINCGGKYSNLASWTPIYNVASIEAMEPEGWASVNKKTCSANASTKNTWFMVPTTEMVTKSYSGQYAVRLRNAAWDINGTEPPRDTRTDRIYYSSNAPELTHRAAGKLFLGSYSFDANGNETYKEGISFTSRPTSVSGVYSYVQDIHDDKETGLVVVKLLHEEDGESVVIGSGELQLSPSTSFTRFVVPIAYTVRDKRATKLQLMISSSCYASYSEAEESSKIRTTDNLEDAVSTGAELIVDDLSLLYE